MHEHQKRFTLADHRNGFSPTVDTQGSDLCW